MESVVQDSGASERGDGLRKGFRIGEWTVRPVEGMLDGSQGEHHLQPKSMDVLLCLARSANEIVERDALIEAVWGQTAVSDEPLTRCIHEIRRELADTRDNPTYIQTVPKRGYRLIAPVELIAMDVAPTGSYRVVNEPSTAEHASVRQLFMQFVSCRVAQAGVAYAIFSWLVVRIAGIALGDVPVGYGIAEWLLPATIVLLMIGFPLAVLAAWLHEVRSTGDRLGKPRASMKRLLVSRSGINVFATATLLAVLAGLTQELLPADVTPPVVADAETIAVLPFEVEGDESAVAWLGDGLAEDLLNLLAEVEGLEVASRNASFRAFPPTTDVVQIGRALNVHYVLKGRVERDADRLRVSVRLIDAQTRHRVWSQAFERPTHEWFAMQEGIAQQVAATLSQAGTDDWPAFRIVDTPMVAVAPTSSVEAYDYHLQARSLLRGPATVESLDTAAEYFARAIQLDPGFASAYAGLCTTIVRQIELRPFPQLIESANEVCRQGISLHHESADTHLAYAELALATGRAERALAEYRWVVNARPRAVEAYVGMAGAYAGLEDYAGAERAYRSAIDVKPGYEPAYRAFGDFLITRGRYGDALDTGRRMIEFYPDSVAGYTILGDASLRAGEFMAAIAAYREVIKREANAAAYASLGDSLYYLGRNRDAMNLYREAAELAPGDHRVWAGIGNVYRQTGDDPAKVREAFRTARKLIEAELEIAPGEPLDSMRLAYYCAALDKKACAFRYSNEALSLAPELASVQYLDALVNLHFEQQAAAIGAVERALQFGYPRALLASDPQLESVRNSPRLSGIFFTRPALARNTEADSRMINLLR